MQPKVARIQLNNQVIEVPIAEVQTGTIVEIRPGERIPVDGEVIHGQKVLLMNP